MASTVRDLQDLIVLLEEHPEWRAQMRRLVLTDDVLALPSIVEEIAAEVRALAEAQRRTEERLEALAEAQRRTEERMGELAAAIHTLVETQKRTEETLRRMGSDLGKLKGDALERRYRERAPYLFARVLRRPRLVPLEELDDRLAEAVERGALTEEDLLDVLAADAVVRGFHRQQDRVIYVVAEVSWVVDTDDVRRAIRRAAHMEKAGYPAVPVVAGFAISESALRMVRELNVQFLEGDAELSKIYPPEYEV